MLAVTETSDTATLAQHFFTITVDDSAVDEKTLAVANFVLGRELDGSNNAGGMLEEHFVELMEYFLPTKD